MFTSSIEDIFVALDRLVKQKGASISIKKELAHLASIDKETWEVVHRICNGDLRCGVGVRTLNEVLPGLIPFTPYLRCKSHRHIDKAKTPGIVQEKANGMYAEMIVEEDLIKFGTRDSHEIHQLDHLKEIFLDSIEGEDTVYMGELRVRDHDGSILDRATGNGIINKCIQNTAKPDDSLRVFFSIWDSVYLDHYREAKSPISYKERFDDVIDTVEILDNKGFCVIDYKYVETIAEAQEYANERIRRGEEGGVYKWLKATWSNSTSSQQFKIKARFEGELRAVRWEYGDKGKKHEHRMGRIIFETDDGLVRTAVGSGFSDEFREEDMEQYMGRIGELAFESVSESKSRKKGDPEYALYGPATFTCWRDDKKDETDTLKELMER